MKYINVMFAGGARFLITLKATPLGSFFRGNSAEKSMSKLLKETRDGESDEVRPTALGRLVQPRSVYKIGW